MLKTFPFRRAGALALALACLLAGRVRAVEVSASAAVLMDMDSGRVLYERNAGARMLIASTTKILTALVAIRDGNLSDTVKVSREAAYTEGSSMYLKEGEELTLRLERRGEKAVVTVRNTGETIPAEELPLLFERFHKSDRSRSADKDGVGLGLYIVRTILEQHRERICAASEDGVTTFSFTVQLAEEKGMTKSV